MIHSFTLFELAAVLQATSWSNGSRSAVVNPIKSKDADSGAEVAAYKEGPETQIPEIQVQGISTDSRQAKSGDVFVALRGERFDGHDFVVTVATQGAIAAVVDTQYQPEDLLPQDSLPKDFVVLQVPDTLAAYQQLGQAWRQRFTGPVVAITGSVGKTTTKELIATVLATADAGGFDTATDTEDTPEKTDEKTESVASAVLKTQANFNNEIGVPKTLLQLDAQHRFAVIEMGMRGLGEIELLSKIAGPDVAVITNVGTAHIERLGSEAAIAQAKSELLIHLNSEGTAILNHDNPLLLEKAAQVWSGQTLTFGFEGGDICGEMMDSETLKVGEFVFSLPLPGRHNAMNFLAALAVAQVLGIDWAQLTQLNLTLPAGRSQRYVLSRDVVLLDETYNAGLESMRAALQLLADTPGQRRIAVLGTMKELGDRSLEFHHLVGKKVAELGIDQLLTLADPDEADALVKGAAGIPSVQFKEAAVLNAYLASEVESGDRLLFKASRAVALDQVVEAFRKNWKS